MLSSLPAWDGSLEETITLEEIMEPEVHETSVVETEPPVNEDSPTEEIKKYIDEFLATVQGDEHAVALIKMMFAPVARLMADLISKFGADTVAEFFSKEEKAAVRRQAFHNLVSNLEVNADKASENIATIYALSAAVLKEFESEIIGS